MGAKTLSRNITSYDMLKTAAVVLMIIDHIGYFFFPEMPIFRALGRLCVPIWMFLVGYARTREISRELWIGGVILAVSKMAVGL